MNLKTIPISCMRIFLLALLALWLVPTGQAQTAIKVTASPGNFQIVKSFSSNNQIQIKLFYPGGGIGFELRNDIAGSGIAGNFKATATSTIGTNTPNNSNSGVTCYNVTAESQQVTTGGFLNNIQISTSQSAFITCPKVDADSILISFTSTGSAFNLDVFGWSLPPGTTQLSGTDPCQSGLEQKATTSINLSASNVVVTATAGQQIWVCGYQFTITGTSPTVQFASGTGASCGTTQGTLSGVMPIPTNTLVTSPGGGTLFTTPSSVGFCILLGGTTPSAQGYIVTVQH